MSRPSLPIGRPDLAAAAYDDAYLWDGSPGTIYRTTMPFWAIGTAAVVATVAIAATGVGLATPVALHQGDVISNVTFVTGTTAAVTPTAGFTALYDSSGNLLAQSADFASTARAASTTYTIPLLTQVTATVDGIYFVDLSFTAGTVPTLYGGQGPATPLPILGSASLARTHGTALGGVAPATIASPTGTGKLPLFVLT